MNITYNATQQPTGKLTIYKHDKTDGIFRPYVHKTFKPDSTSIVIIIKSIDMIIDQTSKF